MKQKLYKRPVLILIVFFILIELVDLATNFVLTSKGSPYTEIELNFIDALVTFVLLAPFMYIMGFRPLMLEIEERKRSERAREDLTRMIAHELRTPLVVMKESVSQLLDGVHGDVPEQQRNILKLSAKNCKRLSTMLDDMLDMAKLDAGKFAITKRPLHLSQVFDEVYDGFKNVVQKRGLELKKRYPVASVSVQVNADHDRILQVLTNLINNAVKFTEKGAIEIGFAKRGDEVECFVNDTGCGISAFDMPRLFGKFQQMSNKAVRGEKGSGLGLMICKGIVELHGGRISAKSEPGQGTKFIFTLPAE